MTVKDFVERVYFAHIEENLRNCTVSGYRRMWTRQIRGRVGDVILRDFRTQTGQDLLPVIIRQREARTTQPCPHQAFSGRRV